LLDLTRLAPVFVVLFYGAGFAVERLFAARPLPRVTGWALRGWSMFVPTMAIGALLPMWVAERFAGHSLVHAEALGTCGGALVGVLSMDFVGYWLHRAQHRFHFLWRFTHQLHHAAERVDVLGAGFFHPADIAIGAVLTSVVVAILGLSEGAVALAGLLVLFMAVLQHTNVRTPVWLGYLMQRPEGHSLHHMRGVHGDNYGNLGLWDLVFGTFRNPAEFAAEAGFYDGASARMRDLLLGRDISSSTATSGEEREAPFRDRSIAE